MNNYLLSRRALVISTLALTNLLPVNAQTPATTVPIRMTVTLDVKGNNKRMPIVRPEDVVIRQGKDVLKVTDWVAACEEQAGLDLFIVIDEAADTSIGVQLADLRSFINAQSPETLVGVGYMSNAGVRVIQDPTTDHAAAAKAVRLPLGTPGAYGSPWFSAADLMRRWPQTSNRRVMLMVTDGRDRHRRGLHFGGPGPLSPDVDTASAVAQRTGTIVYSIYTPGVGHLHHHYWEGINGQNGLAKLSEESGGESFFLGLHPPVSFSPYLDRIQKMLANQYLLTFEARPGKKAGLQRVKLSTEVAGVEFVSADNVWVPAVR